MAEGGASTFSVAQHEERIARVTRATELRGRGLTRVEIAAEMGLSFWTIRSYFRDPDNENGRHRRRESRARRRGRIRCACGAILGKNNESGRCKRCADNALRRFGYQAEDRGYATPCWIWTGNISKWHGCGLVRVEGVLHLAHRFVWERDRGPIPEGHLLFPVCRESSCVNPSHREPVTRSEHFRRIRLATIRAAR